MTRRCDGKDKLNWNSIKTCICMYTHLELYRRRDAETFGGGTHPCNKIAVSVDSGMPSNNIDGMDGDTFIASVSNTPGVRTSFILILINFIDSNP